MAGAQSTPALALGEAKPRGTAKGRREAAAARTYPQTLPLSPSERRAYNFLAAASEPVSWHKLLQHLDGTVDPARRPNVVRVVANIRLALRPFRRESVANSGKNDALHYQLVALPAPDPDAAVAPGEIARLLKRGFGVANVAEAFGLSKEAVLAVAGNLAEHPPEPRPAPPEAPAKVGRRNPPGSITLAPCGYSEWVVRPNGAHAIQRPGEADLRILTVQDRTVHRLTTDGAPVEPRAEA